MTPTLKTTPDEESLYFYNEMQPQWHSSGTDKRRAKTRWGRGKGDGKITIQFLSICPVKLKPTQNQRKEKKRKEETRPEQMEIEMNRLHPAVTRSTGRNQEKEKERGRHEGARHGVARHYSHLKKSIHCS